MKDGVVQPYKPAAWNDIPDGLKDPAGNWFTIHSGTLGFMVNVDALKGKPIPKSWADLLKPEYKGLVGYLDPASAFVGYVGAVAVNQARGGTLADFGPGIEYFKQLMKNEPIVPKQTSYARVLSGEIAILLDYDFNAYRAKYKDGANVAFVIPTEGTLVVPYVMSLVAKAPHAADAKKALDFVLSDEGQAIWANAYLRPGACERDAEGRAGEVPAGQRVRAREVRRLRTDGRSAARLLGPLPEGSALKSRADRVVAQRRNAALAARRLRGAGVRVLRRVLAAAGGAVGRAAGREGLGDVLRRRHRRPLSAEHGEHAAALPGGDRGDARPRWRPSASTWRDAASPGGACCSRC